MGTSKSDVFSHGFFQDILTLMTVLKQDTITQSEIESYVREKLLAMEKMGRPGTPQSIREKKQKGEKRKP